MKSALIHTSLTVISVSTGLPAAANWPTSVRRSVTRPAERARISRVGQVQFGFRERGRCAAQLRIVFVAAAFLLAGPLNFGFGGRDLATACSKVAREISRRRSEMVPGSS